MTTWNQSDMADPADLDLSSSPYASQLEAALPNIGNMVEAQSQPGESWLDTLTRMLPGLVATYQQKQILGVQMDRARQGLPPLDMSQYGMGVNIGLSPATQKMVMMLGGGLLLVLFLSRR